VELCTWKLGFRAQFTRQGARLQQDWPWDTCVIVSEENDVHCGFYLSKHAIMETENEG